MSWIGQGEDRQRRARDRSERDRGDRGAMANPPKPTPNPNPHPTRFIFIPSRCAAITVVGVWVILDHLVGVGREVVPLGPRHSSVDGRRCAFLPVTAPLSDRRQSDEREADLGNGSAQTGEGQLTGCPYADQP